MFHFLSGNESINNLSGLPFTFTASRTCIINVDKDVNSNSSGTAVSLHDSVPETESYKTVSLPPILLHDSQVLSHESLDISQVLSHDSHVLSESLDISFSDRDIDLTVSDSSVDHLSN